MRKFIFWSIVLWFATSCFSLDLTSEKLWPLYLEVCDGNIEEIKEVIKDIDSFLKNNPDHPAAQVYKGSLNTIIADKSIMFWNKLSFLRSGISLMEMGISSLEKGNSYKLTDKDILRVRMVRGQTSAQIPYSFKQVDTGIKELESVITHKDFYKIDDTNRTISYAYLAKLYLEKDFNKKSHEMIEEAKKLDSAIALKIWRE